MKIGILSYYHTSKRASPEELRLLKEARALGHKARIIRAVQCQLVFDGKNPTVLFEGKAFPKFDVIIPRVTLLRAIELQTALLKQFQLMGVPVINGFRPINRAKNKLNTMQTLNHHNLGIPRTIVIRRMREVDWAVKYLGGLPVIIKTPFGTYGSGVVISESKRSLTSSLDAIWGTQDISIILLQEFIKESKGKDIRVFVVGGKVVASMMRAAVRGEFRSNIELGGAGEKVDITPEEEILAIKATEALGLHMGGVDIVRSKSGPLVLEVNGNPGFKKLEEVTGINVAKAIIEYVVTKVSS